MADRSYALTLNGDNTEGLDPAAGPLPEQLGDWLHNLEGRRRYSLILWPLPPGTTVAHADFDRDCEEYLQCAGSAERMTVEMRTLTGQEAAQYVVGREPEHRGEPDTAVAWQEVTTMVFADEVWSAEEATPLFVAYADTGDLPAGLGRRRLVF